MASGIPFNATSATRKWDQSFSEGSEGVAIAINSALVNFAMY